MSDWSEVYSQELDRLDRLGLKRSLKNVTGPQGRIITIDGREVLNFCSNNYLGLANAPEVVDAVFHALNEEGFGAGASRLVNGNMQSHRRLEEEIAHLKKAQRCLLFSCGYMANVGILSGLFGRDDVIFSDKLNHASIVDGIILSRAEHKRYPHKDMVVLEAMLAKTDPAQRKAIVTDSVFSMDGDWAPLKEIVTLARRYNAMVMVDEAHAFGVIGSQGAGLVDYLGLQNQVDIQMGTLSKAIGGFGAYCCAQASIIDYLINSARSFIYTTGLPASVAAGNLRAIHCMKDHPHLRQRLLDNAELVRRQLHGWGFDTLGSNSAIIPVLLGDAQLAVEFSRRLMLEGIFVQAIRPPTVPAGTSRLRITVMASHTSEDLDSLFKAVYSIGLQLNVINKSKFNQM